VSTRTSALDALVFGVDVQSGDVRGDAPAYALVVFDGEPLERDIVSRRKLLRLLDDREPSMLATDNAFELAEDKQALIRLLGALPTETTLVQVTGDERPEPLSRVASRHGVPYGKNPMKEAEAAARLAANNVGSELSAFTNTTEIKVSRGRSTGSGGWSEDRYTRRIHGSVKNAARRVESDLDDAGLDYERDATEKYGGFSNALFTVEATPEEIPVSARRAGDVRVEVEPVRRDGIEYRPLVVRRDHVIVGIDPGTTTAVALVDVDGETLEVWSSRTIDTSELIEWIIERGRPVVVAADVTPMPNTVEKIRRSFDATDWVPERDLLIDEKQHRTREHGYDNDHQRDALAAALFAFDDYEETVRKVSSEISAADDRGEMIARVVAGGESLEAVLAEDSEEHPENDGTEAATEPAEPSPEQRRIQQLETQVESLQTHVEALEAELDDREDEIEEYETALSEARREERRDAQERRSVTRLERTVERLETERDEQAEANEALEAKLERLKALWRLDHSNFADVEEAKQGLVPVKPIAKFTRAAIEDAEAAFGLAPDDVVLLEDATGAGAETARYLASLEPRVVLTDGGLSDRSERVLFQTETPFGPAEDVPTQKVDELVVARQPDVEAVLEAFETRAARRRAQQTEAMVDQLISEHRAGTE